MAHNLPVTVLSWAIAILPLAILVVLLLVLKSSIVKAGIVALVVTALTAAFAFDTPLQGVAVGLGRGVWNSLEVVAVILAALILYRICLHAGAFEAVRSGVTKLSENYLFLVLMIGWVFVSFIQGVSGFGTPVLIAAPILMGIGVKPIFAVIIPLISQGWSNLFGALGIAWTVTSNLVQLDSETLTILYSSSQLAIGAVTSGFFIAWLYAGWSGVKESWLIVVIGSVLMAGGQVLTALWNPLLGVTIPAFLTLIVMYLLARMDRFKEPSPNQDDSRILDLEDAEGGSEFENAGNLSLHQALLPFYVLTAITVVALGITPLAAALSQVEIPGPSVSGVTTGYDYTTAPAQNYSPITVFTNPTPYLLLSSLIGYLWYRSQDCYQQTDQLGRDVVRGVISGASSPVIAIFTFLMLAQVLLVSGQNTVLALGISAVTSPVVYAALAPWIGAASVFLTSSVVAGNTLFGPLQQSVVQTMPGLSLNQMIAHQSAGGSIANAIGPSNVVLGATTANVQDQQSTIYKYGLSYVGLTVALFSVVAVLMHLLLPR